MAKTKQSSPNLPGINAAIIMDGNGRWAKKNALNVTSGHQRGVDVVRKIVESAAKAQLESLSLYAFSTENWSRPKKEILGIKKLIINAIDSQVPELINQEVRLNFFGDYSSFGDEIIRAIHQAEKITAFKKPKLKLNIALGYGGRKDIIEAINIGIDFFAVFISSSCSSKRPVVPETKGSSFSIQKLTESINPFGEEKSITADIPLKAIASV